MCIVPWARLLKKSEDQDKENDDIRHKIDFIEVTFRNEKETRLFQGIIHYGAFSAKKVKYEKNRSLKKDILVLKNKFCKVFRNYIGSRCVINWVLSSIINYNSLLIHWLVFSIKCVENAFSKYF